ncbi:FecR domain-containing protein [Pelagicoccus sp. SDUM812005]|uniref:FecR family protein n=1 Tax=Pelagicoccus sp. SDUM812005 TaxID=3041257 RepID=UPI00280E37C6|nr:FecR domain-containing protein [Pelagicoccus sp. SDUM812005]MDQ8182915.1 FecR domain-containing protein [Pelagicoccus sp. SDUM812005]
MKQEDFESNEAGRIDREAAEWVAKRIGGFRAEDQDAFFDWLAADPRHGEWYQRHLKLWKKMDMLSLWMPEHSQEPNRDLLKSSKARFGAYWIGGLAAAIAIAFSAFLFLGESFSGSEHGTQNFVAKAYESHELPDGSVIELNAGAALRVDYTPKFRRVELVSSEAHFSVAKDPSRPFVVVVRGVEVTAVGTAFSVNLEGDSVRVIVTEGRVALVSRPAGGEAPDAEKKVSSTTRELSVGQMSEVLLTEENPVVEVKAVSLGDMNSLLSWKPQMFVFNSTPLAKVVEEFNRRNQTHLVIGDSQIGNYPLVASFRSANVDHFVELLELSIGLRVERNEKEGLITLYAPLPQN